LILEAYPIHLSADSTEKRAVAIPSHSSGELLVVIDLERVQQAALPRRFSQTDWSFAWLNFAEQEFGPFTLVDRRRLRTTDLAHFRYVLVTQSVAGITADLDLAQQLERYARAGGVVVLERPTGPLRSAFSADGTKGDQIPRTLEVHRGLAEPFSTQLEQMPLMTRYIASSAPPNSASTYLSMDGVPVVYRKEIGRGHAITVEFDMGRQLVSLQQGLPADDFSVRHSGDGEVKTTDLIGDPALLDNAVPYADLLERFLALGVIGDARPVVSLWTFPHASQGVMLMTHEEGGMGDASTWMADWEKGRAQRSTYFVTATGSLSRGAARRIQRADSEIQLQWVHSLRQDGLFEAVGSDQFELVRRELSLGQQLATLQEGTGAAITASRSKDGVWSSSWSGAFRAMAAANIRLDSSYVPGPGGRGYLRGTGLPFQAMDDNGLPVGVTEIPVLISESVDPAYVANLFGASRDGHHQALTLHFGANTYHRSPSVSLFDTWIAAYDLAAATQHAVMTLTGYAEFFRARGKVRLRSSIRRASLPEDKLTAEDGDKPGDGEVTPGILLRIEADAPEVGHAVCVPSAALGLPIRRVWRGDPEAESPPPTIRPKNADVVGHRVRLISLRRGANLITVEYRR
jgi:hypothetical protein